MPPDNAVRTIRPEYVLHAADTAVRAERVYVDTVLFDPAEHSRIEPTGESAPFVACLAHEMATQVFANDVARASCL
jgi:hypothetical protein